MDLTQPLRMFSIRHRMLGAIASMLVLLALVGGVGLWSLMRVEAINLEFAAQTHADTSTLAELRTAIGDVRRFEKDMVIHHDSTAQQAVYRPGWAQAVENTRRYANQLANRQDAAQVASAHKIDLLLKAYAEKAAVVLRQIEVLGFNDAPVAHIALGPARKLVDSAEAEITALAALLDFEAARSKAQHSVAVRQAFVLFGAAILIAIGVVVPVTLVNMLSICRSIERARSVAQRIAAGDLTQSIVVEGRDEASQLLKALASMQGSLRQMVGQVRASTDHISVASAEIATGSQDLSDRTELAASNLQQAAASMAQLTGAVRQSAESARQAHQLARSAAEVAARGGVVVSQVVATMDGIHAASKRIADIIGTIDGIAFQTHLLALNAAVEAARAGEQGRGFAVVASEVRSLAHRSAEAAKEIKDLIGASVEKVQGGSQLVADAGHTMNEIVSSVQRVSGIISEISAASTEQSEGIGQINGSVNRLDHMTQQNAALVEQSTAAARSLNEQAGTLTQVLGRFKLGEPGRKVQAATAPPAPQTRRLGPDPVRFDPDLSERSAA